MTNNPIEILVQLAVDETPSKTKLDAQIQELSKKLETIDIKIDIDSKAVTALENLSKIDVDKLTESLKKAQDEVTGVGKGASKAGDEITRSFADAQKTIDATFSHLGKDFQQSMRQGVTEVGELKKAFEGMDASFKSVDEILSEDETGNVQRRVKAIEASYKNLEGQIERVKFVQDGSIDMGDGSLKPLWMPENEVRVLDSSMKSISEATRKANTELGKLHSTGKITTDQFAELSQSLNSMKHPNSINLYNQRLTETVSNNKKINNELKVQEQIQERIRKLTNSITAQQARDPKSFGNNPEVTGMLESLRQIDPASKGAEKAVKGVSDSFDTMKAEATAAGRESMTVMDSFKVAMEKFPVWMAASTAFYGTIRSIRSAIDQIVEIDSQMTVMRRVAGEQVNINNVLEESVRLAGELGNEIADINEGFIAFARQGFRGDELTSMAEYATLLGNISDLTVDESASILTAGIKGFNIEAENSIHIVNALNEVDNNYSITTKDLGVSLMRSAGAARAYGVSMEETIGYTTAIGQVTRESGSIIGKQSAA